MTALTSLELLDLSGCHLLAQLPQGLTSMPALRTIMLGGCPHLTQGLKKAGSMQNGRESLKVHESAELRKLSQAIDTVCRR